MSTESSGAKFVSSRIVSMDQFRGYTVAGMFLVNFVGGLAAFPEVLKHHNGHPYFSYADTIMPSFMFAAGFSYRLTILRRLAQQGPARTYGHILIRSLALVLVSLVMYVDGGYRRDPRSGPRSRPRGLEVRRRVAQGEPLGSPGDHRGDPDPAHAGDRREHAGPDHRLDRLRGRPPAHLVLVQLRLRLRAAERAG